MPKFSAFFGSQLAKKDDASDVHNVKTDDALKGVDAVLIYFSGTISYACLHIASMLRLAWLPIAPCCCITSCA